MRKKFALAVKQTDFIRFKWIFWIIIYPQEEGTFLGVMRHLAPIELDRLAQEVVLIDLLGFAGLKVVLFGLQILVFFQENIFTFLCCVCSTNIFLTRLLLLADFLALFWEAEALLVGSTADLEQLDYIAHRVVVEAVAMLDFLVTGAMNKAAINYIDPIGVCDPLVPLVCRFSLLLSVDFLFDGLDNRFGLLFGGLLGLGIRVYDLGGVVVAGLMGTFKNLCAGEGP